MTLDADTVRGILREELAAHASVTPLAYSVDQAAEALGVSPSTVRSLIHRGDLPTVDGFGRRQLIPRMSLEAFVSERASTSSGSAGSPPAHGEHGTEGVDGRADDETVRPLAGGTAPQAPARRAHAGAIGTPTDEPPDAA